VETPGQRQPLNAMAGKAKAQQRCALRFHVIVQQLSERLPGGDSYCSFVNSFALEV
jgi:hypothetical protein